MEWKVSRDSPKGDRRNSGPMLKCERLLSSIPKVAVSAVSSVFTEEGVVRTRGEMSSSRALTLPWCDAYFYVSVAG